MSDDLPVIAHHEAGHVIAAWRLGIPVSGATIIPDNERGSLGHMAFASRIDWQALAHDGSDRARMRVEREIITTLAGGVAEGRFLGRPASDDSTADDREHAADLALWLNGSGEIASAYLAWLQLRAGAMVAANWPWIEAVAAALLERQTLSGRAAKQIIRDAIAAKAAAANPVVRRLSVEQGNA